MSPSRIEERSAAYTLQTAGEPALGTSFDLLATAPQGVAKLRGLILSLALRGQLVPQSPADEPSEELLTRSRQDRAKKMAAGQAKREKTALSVKRHEERFALPARWTWCRVIDTGEYINGLAFKPSDWGKSGRPIIRIQNLSGRNQDFNRTTKDVDVSVIVKSGDILVSWSATLDAFIWRGEEGVLNQHIFRVTPSLLVERGFLFWLLKGVIKDLSASDHAHGLVMSHINRGPFLAYPVAIPPLSEQARIVARVEELMQLCDALESHGRLQDEQHARLVATLFDTLAASESAEALAENWQRIATHFDLLLDRPEAVDALEQTLLQLAVRGLLVPQDSNDEPAAELLGRIHVEGVAPSKVLVLPSSKDDADLDVPRGWVHVRMGDVFEFLNGYAFKSDWFTPHGIRLVRNVNVAHGSLDWSDTACIDASREREFERFALRKDDVVISLDRPIISTGLKYAVIKDRDLPCLLLQRVARLSTRVGAVTDGFMHLWLNSPQFVASIDPGRSNGVPHISTKQLSSTPFSVPPLAEQHRIVARVEQLRRLCADLRERLQQARATQSRLADALVSAAGQSPAC